MAQDLKQEIQALQEKISKMLQTDFQQHPFSGTLDKHKVNVGISMTKEQLSKVKGIVKATDLGLSNFMYDAIENHIKKIELDHGKPFDPIDYRTRLSYGARISTNQKIQRALATLRTLIENETDKKNDITE